MVKPIKSTTFKGLVFKTHGTETRKLIREALSLAPQSINALASLAYFYSTKGDIEKGTSAFQKIMGMHGTNPNAKYNNALWLSNLYDCQYKKDAVCSFAAFPKKGNNFYAAPLEHNLSSQKKGERLQTDKRIDKL